MKKLLSIMLSLFIALSIAIPAAFNSVDAASNNILITEVYYDTNLSYEPEEYIAITNPTGSAVDISGWVITNPATPCRSQAELPLPPGTRCISPKTLADSRNN